MKLDKLDGGSVYVDTNVLYMYLRSDPNHIPVIKTFLRRVVRGEINAHVGLLVLDELFYRLLLARVKDSTNRNPIDVLREDLVRIIKEYSGPIEMAIRKLIFLPHMNISGIETTDLDRMMNNIKTFSLLPRDALHVATMQRLGLTDVASDDMDFDRVEWLTRHWIINPPDKRNH